MRIGICLTVMVSGVSMGASLGEDTGAHMCVCRICVWDCVGGGEDGGWVGEKGRGGELVSRVSVGFLVDSKSKISRK